MFANLPNLPPVVTLNKSEEMYGRTYQNHQHLEKVDPASYVLE
jgi:hypothetical protein